METEQITIRVDPTAARIYRAASPEEQRKLEVLISLRLLEASRSDASLEEIMNEISKWVQARGLTPEILSEGLADRIIMELHGLGKEIWGEGDAQEYVDQLRDEWEQPVSTDEAQ